MVGWWELSVAFGVTLATAPVVLSALRRRKVLDQPNARSAHQSAIPRGGGIAPLCGILAALLASSDISGRYRVALLVAVASFGVLGLGEDLVGIPPAKRLCTQGVLAFPPVLLAIGTPSPWPLYLLVVPAAVFLVVGYTNAFNFMDGINGISVAQATVAGATWFLVGATTEEPAFAAGGALLAGAALGFAPFNLVRPLMFLGDSGSYLLGAYVAVLAMIGLRSGIPAATIGLPLGLYLVDTTSTLLGRLWRHENVMEPHAQHVYQRIARAKGHLFATVLAFVVMSTCAALGLLALFENVAVTAAAVVASASVLTLYALSYRTSYRHP